MPHANFKKAFKKASIKETSIKVLCAALATLLLGGCEPNFEEHIPTVGSDGQPRTATGWQQYGGSSGTKFISASQINKDNVEDLEIAWVYRTGDTASVFQNTPIISNGQLLVCTPYNKIISLDPLTGQEIWQFDPQISRDSRPANEFNCRGVAQHKRQSFLTSYSDLKSNGLSKEPTTCSTRIFLATIDARLIALDADTGGKCTNFGDHGSIDLTAGVGETTWAGEYTLTSPPAVINNVVVVGSAISDGNRLTAPSGVVRGYDAISGDLVWAFDLAPPNFDYTNMPVSSAGYALGTPNVWSAMAVDVDRDMVFLPTGNPAPDYDRPADHNLSFYGSSVIALRASTGEVLWSFQTVINDFWDYDVPAQPVLTDLIIEGESVPVVIQATKMGFVFVLHRDTGEHVIDVEYRTVPTHGPLADRLSTTQPFPGEAYQLSRSYEAGSSILGLCDQLDAESVIGPIYTPITEEWTVGLPSNMGAINWGGIAVHPELNLIVAHTNSVPFRTKLIPRSKAQDLLDIAYDESASEAERQAAKDAFYERFNLPPGTEVARQIGAQHLMARHTYLDPTLGAPCAGTPMGEMMVIDTNSHTIKWRVPHGTVRDFAGLPFTLGVPGVGGPMVTDSGLIFIGGAAEKAIRAYDLATGETLWQHRLPHPGNATPMSYTVSSAEGDKQFVVIAAGGDARAGIGGIGDYVVAFALPATQ